MSVPYSLRGDPAKKRFLHEHPEAKCIEHSALLPGEQSKCCCGEKLEGEYYCFSYGPEKKKQSFFAGPSCGKSLVTMGNLLVPPMCDPFGLLHSDSKKQNHPERQVDGGRELGRLPENKEMTQAISLLLFLWSPNSKEGPLSRLREALQTDPKRKVYPNNLESLSRAIHSTSMIRYKKAMTLRQMLDEIASKHNRKVKCSFRTLEKYYRDASIDCNL